MGVDVHARAMAFALAVACFGAMAKGQTAAPTAAPHAPNDDSNNLSAGAIAAIAVSRDVTTRSQSFPLPSSL